MGGPSKSVQTAQQGLVAAQTAEANSLTNFSNTALANYTSQTQPLINYDTGVVNAANKGDYSGLLQAAGPAIGTINQQEKSAQSNIMRNIPAGPGRDAALAALPAQAGGAVSSTLNSTFQDALKTLAGQGNSAAGIGLQGAGGALSGMQGAGSANVQLGQMQAAASPWNAIASLAGAAGTAVGGTNFKSGGGGGGDREPAIP